MKKIICVIAMLLLSIGIVAAGSINNLQYNDSSVMHCYPNNMGNNCDKTRTTNDDDVFIDADTVNGVDVNKEIYYNQNRIKANKGRIARNGRATAYNSREIGKTKNYISNNEASWKEDKIGGGGMSKGTMFRYLVGNKLVSSFFDEWDNFKEWVEWYFISKEEAHNRMDRLQAMIMIGWNASDDDLSLKATQIKAVRTGEQQTWDGYTCYRDGMCLKIW